MMHILGKFCLLCLPAFTLFTCADFIASQDDSDPPHTVTYDGNGNTSGSVPADSFKYARRENVTVKSNSGSLAKTGCTFIGWNTKNDGSGRYCLPGAKFPIGNADVTLYARWAAPGTALWARSIASGSDYTQFSGAAADSSGNVYAVGTQTGNSAYTYGTESAAGAYSGGENAVIVMYVQ